MKLSDWYLDLQDFLGKLLPGFIIIIEIVLLYNVLNNKFGNDFILLLEDTKNFYKNLTYFEFFITLAISYIVGSYSTYAAFRLMRDPFSNIFYRPIWIRFLIENKKEKEKNEYQSYGKICLFFCSFKIFLSCLCSSIKALFRNGRKDKITIKSFLDLYDPSKEVLTTFKNGETTTDGQMETNYWNLQPYYKLCLAELSPQSFLHLKKIEAHINFYTGMTIPLIIAIIIGLKFTISLGFSTYNWLVILLIFLILFIVNILAMLRLTEEENYLTFVLYHAVMEKNAIQAKENGKK